MLKKRKAQGLSFQTLVVLALAVLVLIVLAVLLMQRYSKGSEQLDYVSSEWEYKAACLSKYAQEQNKYDDCVEDCKKAAADKKFLAQCKLEDKNE